MSLKIALVGHVDNGKSTVIGRLLADSGQTRDERREKVRSFCESTGRKFEYAFLLDALEEEQTQGITIDVTEVNWIYKNREVTFVDTPGHHEFLKKMIGGASRVDTAIQVVDALEGVNDSFRRQSEVLSHLGVTHRVVLVNKMDLAQWSEKIYLQRRDEIQNSFSQSDKVHILPTAAWSGDNLIEASSHMPWYQGPTLAEIIFSLPITEKNIHAPLRFSVQDVYKFDQRRILAGRVESGTLRTGDEIVFAPGNLKSRVLTIEKFGENPQTAGSGESVGITLADPLFVDRGYLGYPAAHPPRTEKQATADLFWLGEKPLKRGDRVKIKAGTQAVDALVDNVHFDLHSDSLAEDTSAGAVSVFGRVDFQFLKDFTFDTFDVNESTGRFVVTQGGAVLGGGRWLQNNWLHNISNAEKNIPPLTPNSGLVLWFTGFSGAGKTTIANALKNKLLSQGQGASVLDGDNLRQGLCRDLGFSPEDRVENLRRAAEVAKLMADAGLLVITSFISPYAASREQARSIVGAQRFLEIFVDCPIAECESRDVKGLYAKARRGEVAEFTGISSAYEAPLSPALRLNSQKESIADCVDELINLIHNYLENPVLIAKESL